MWQLSRGLNKRGSWCGGPEVVACLVGKSKVGSNSSGRSWGRQVLWGNGFQLAQGCPPKDILEIGGGDGIIAVLQGVGQKVVILWHAGLSYPTRNWPTSHSIFRHLAGYLCMCENQFLFFCVCTIQPYYKHTVFESWFNIQSVFRICNYCINQAKTKLGVLHNISKIWSSFWKIMSPTAMSFLVTESPVPHTCVGCI